MTRREGVVYVTGAASGIGRRAAERLVDAGATVAAIDVDEVGLAATARGHAAIRPFVVDVADSAAVAENVRRVERELGPIVQAYAAAAYLRSELLLEQDVATIFRIMDVGYRGVVNVAKSVLPGMLARGRGDLVHFASMGGWVPGLYLGAYCAMKHAVVAFTEALAHENRGGGVRILCVCPAPVATPMLDAASMRSRLMRHPAFPAITPDRVLDAIERDLVRGRLFCFPSRRTKLGWYARRFAPGLLWRFAHSVEGF
jgi:NAD(P)-dependent dehydrogenase (short-subunit alcohol dehydrogenase family)